MDSAIDDSGLTTKVVGSLDELVVKPQARLRQSADVDSIQTTYSIASSSIIRN